MTSHKRGDLLKVPTLLWDDEFTTTSVKNPDGSHTITSKDENGRVISTQTVRATAATVSVTDLESGVTKTAVTNPDGTQTVTELDNTGKLISRGRFRYSPGWWSATNLVNGRTLTVVRNPNGSDSTYETDEAGNVVGRSKASAADDDERQVAMTYAHVGDPYRDYFEFEGIVVESGTAGGHCYDCYLENPYPLYYH